MEQSGHLLTRYFGGLVIQVIIVTAVVGLGLTLLNIPGWLLGLLAGLCNLIPRDPCSALELAPLS